MEHSSPFLRYNNQLFVFCFLLINGIRDSFWKADEAIASNCVILLPYMNIFWGQLQYKTTTVVLSFQKSNLLFLKSTFNFFEFYIKFQFYPYNILHFEEKVLIDENIIIL